VKRAERPVTIPAMASTWTHPKRGQFKYDGTGWLGEVDAPGFDAFQYDSGYSNAGPPTGKYELLFEADSEKDVPSAAAVALAEKVLADPAKLVTKVTAALWGDFTGRGPGSGMWWHGDLDQVAEAMDDADLPPPQGPDDLLNLMRLFQITIRKGADGYDKPVAELCFWAPFEEEHNVGVLTDGEKVLGAGYHIDVRPFMSE
jgi:hypothetical protein